MTEERDSYRRILAATGIVGGASVVAIIIGLLRTKLIALGVGPEGIGLMGVYMSVMATAAALGGMGLGFSAVRQLSADEAQRPLARRALWLASWPLALIAGILVWLAREEIARLVTGTDGHALAVGLTGIGVALSILSVSQLAVLQGYRRIGSLAKARIGGALLSLIIGVPSALYGGELGLVAAVIAVPLGASLAALPFRPASETRAAGAAPIGEQWSAMFRLGAAMTLATTLMSGALVAIRAILIDSDGIAAAGLYHAAFTISAMNISLVLAAMAADYFPRLSEAARDPAAANRLVNQQLHSALLLGGPLLIAMAAFAPLVLEIFYAGGFRAAAPMLRWQVAGELFKLPGWALAFLLVARGDTRGFLMVETLFVFLYTGGCWLLAPIAGLAGVGLAYLVAYGLYSAVLLARCRSRHHVRMSAANLVLLATAVAAVGLTIAATLLGEMAGVGVGLLLTAAFALYSLRELNRLGGIVAGLRAAKTVDAQITDRNEAT